MFFSRRPSPSRLTTAAIPVIAALGATTLTGCAALGISDSAAEPANASLDGRPEVVAAFYPLAWVAEQVAGDRADVVNLTTPGGEPHDLELGVQQTSQLSAADLVVYERGFQPAVDGAVEEDVDSGVLDAGEVVGLMEYGGDEAHDEGHEEGHDEGHEDEAHHEGDGHDHGEGLDGLDPHFWHDPLKMAALADAVAERLSDLDPQGADTYAANAEATVTALEQLDSAYADGLAQCARDVTVVNHGAFGYLARYGLDFEPITGLTPNAEPTAGDLARLQDVIADEGITTVFYERLVSPQTARALAGDTGAEAAVLDPIEGLTDETADEDYLSLMRANLAALERANGC